MCPWFERSPVVSAAEWAFVAVACQLRIETSLEPLSLSLLEIADDGADGDNEGIPTDLSVESAACDVAVAAAVLLVAAAWNIFCWTAPAAADVVELAASRCCCHLHCSTCSCSY